MLPNLILAISGVCLLVCLYFLALTRDLYNNRKKREEELIAHADHQTQHLIEKAKEQALEIISAANTTASDNKRSANDRATKMAKEHLEEFEKNLQTISETLKTVTSKEATQFRQALEMETTKGQKLVTDKLAAEYDQVIKQVVDYKKEKLALADAEVNKIVHEVFEKIAGKLIPVSQQQELVMQALEEAKKDHVF